MTVLSSVQAQRSRECKAWKLSVFSHFFPSFFKGNSTPALWCAGSITLVMNQMKILACGSSVRVLLMTIPGARPMFLLSTLTQYSGRPISFLSTAHSLFLPTLNPTIPTIQFRQLHGYTPGYHQPYPHPYPQNTHTHSCGYGYQSWVEKSVPWVRPIVGNTHGYPVYTTSHLAYQGFCHTHKSWEPTHRKLPNSRSVSFFLV
jgi:hypothetical protein